MTVPGDRRTIFLDEMGVGPLWSRRVVDLMPPQVEAEIIVEAAAQHVTSDPAFSAWETAPSPNTAPQSGSIEEMNWAQLKTAVSGCRQCGLCEKRSKTVFGTGDEKAKWLFIGEGPGRSEDAKGEPFVGPAGKLLDNMLGAINLKRGANAYIANIVKCRPIDVNGKDRPPSVEEAAACMPYLQRQIALLQPNVIVALGKTAALTLLNRDPATSVSTLRGTVHRYAERPLIVTYHPAYLLRNPVDKRKTWADLCLAMQAYLATE